MKYLSLFSGIGGFELGIQKAYEQKNKGLVNKGGQVDSISRGQKAEYGTRMGDTYAEQPSNESNQSIPICIGYSEIDKYAIQIYQSHFPDHKNYGNITKINVRGLPDFDLLVGGFPCQAFSIAGKRRGFDDTRGTLFFDIARILKEKRPRNFILENVKGLLSHDNGRTFKTIISTLTELGYCVEWQVLNAKNFGVPQNRERVFIVGHLGGIPERKVFPIEGEYQSVVSKGGEQVWDDRNKRFRDISPTIDQPEHNSIRLVQLNKPRHSNERIYGTGGLSPTLNTAQGGNRQPKIANTLDANYHKGNSVSSKRHTPRTEITEGSTIRRLTPLECERLMGYPDGWTEGLSDTQRYKTLGNGVVSNVVEEVVKRLLR